MVFSHREWIFGGTKFCCCLPVRFGVITMSGFGILVAGFLSLILWFQVSVAKEEALTSGELAAFVIAALVQTFLFVGSILGFVGAIVRKQSFLQVYAWFLYVHLILNLGVAIYLFVVLTQFHSNAIRVACENTIGNAEAQDQCKGVLTVAGKVFIAVTAIVLVMETYGAVIVTRYLNLVKREKRDKKDHKRANDSAFSLEPLNRGFNTRLGGSSIYAPLSQADEVFDPYRDTEAQTPGHSRFTTDRTLVDEHDVDKPPIPIEAGYGGGAWTHSEITAEEKSRLERSELGEMTVNINDLTEEERARRRSEIKTPYGPSSSPPLSTESDQLPQIMHMDDLFASTPDDRNS
ncbi:hypothetical protein FA13DRAFT_1761465 [Coprinellus micaceus]|uniref:Uncharacterized protein n=1 Tax=Coprinellus micaceus TaxID=71717 RepID=A0A4Y7TW39_COPMI|nr:hypothetical protein FA13DRAFT_1761465 [Coprinellus micaceus]